MAEEVELQAKLKLDTSDATRQLKGVAKEADKAGTSADGIKLPDDVTSGLKNLFSGEKGLGNLTKVAAGAAGGIKGLGNALAGVTSVLGKAGGLIGLILAIVGLVVKMMQGTDTWEKLSDTLGEITDTIQESLAPTLALIGELFIQTLGVIMPLIEPVMNALNENLKPVLTILVKIVKALKPVTELFSSLWNAIEGLKKRVQDFITMITFGLVTFDQTVASTTGLKQQNFKTSLDVWETSGEAAQIEKLAQLQQETAEDSWNKIVGISKDACEEIVELFEIAIGKVKPKVLISPGVAKGGGNQFMYESMTGYASGSFQKIPLHKEGGTIRNGAQVWGMNESGNPEFIFNAGGRDTVVNADILAEAVYKGVVRAVSGRQTTQRIEVGVREGTPAGPRELAQWLLPSLKFALGR